MGYFISPILLFLSLFLNLLAGPIHQTQPDDDLERRAKGFIEQLNQGKYEDAYGSFDDEMRKAISIIELQGIWEDIIGRYGEYQSTSNVRIEQVGQYTAVNVETLFEKATVNIRVVFSNTGQISGLFYSPLQLTAPASSGMLVSLLLTGLFTIVFPIILAVYFQKRFSISWKYFFLGAAIFVIFQLLTRIPIISMIEVMFGRQLRATPWILAIWIIFLSFTAGLFEEFGRYVGYRWMMNRDPKTWKIGVLYGLGHGGIESIILVGVNNLAAFGLLLFLPVIQRIFPQEITGALNQQVALLTGIPSWMPLLASWERFWTIPVHVALSVIVLQVFIRRGIKWLWMAIGFHTIVNLFVVGLVTILPISAEKNPILVSIPVAIVGLLAVWIIWRFRVSEIKVI